MKKVYIVTSGKYSDYGICGIFTTKKLAHSFINSFNEHTDFNDIEEYELDPYKIHLESGNKPYSLCMDIEGNTCHIEQSDLSHEFNGPMIEIYFSRDRKWMYVNCFAKNETHAIKIANEKRAQYIASNTWGK